MAVRKRTATKKRITKRGSRNSAGNRSGTPSTRALNRTHPTDSGRTTSLKKRRNARQDKNEIGKADNAKKSHRASKLPAPPLVAGTPKEITGVLFWCCALLTTLSLVSYSAKDASLNGTGGELVHNWIGPAGAYWADLLLQFFGVAAFAFAVTLFVAGARAFAGFRLLPSLRESLSTTILVISLGAFCELAWVSPSQSYPPGGILGAIAGDILRQQLAQIGGLIVSGAICLVSLTFIAQGGLQALGKKSTLNVRELLLSLGEQWVTFKERKHAASILRAERLALQTNEQTSQWRLGIKDQTAAPQAAKHKTKGTSIPRAERLSMAKRVGQLLAEEDDKQLLSSVRKKRIIAEREPAFVMGKTLHDDINLAAEHIFDAPVVNMPDSISVSLAEKEEEEKVTPQLFQMPSGQEPPPLPPAVLQPATLQPEPLKIVTRESSDPQMEQMLTEYAAPSPVIRHEAINAERRGGGQDHPQPEPQKLKICPPVTTEFHTLKAGSLPQGEVVPPHHKNITTDNNPDSDPDSTPIAASKNVNNSTQNRVFNISSLNASATEGPDIVERLPLLAADEVEQLAEEAVLDAEEDVADNYEIPPPSILKFEEGQRAPVDAELLKYNAQRLTETLQTYGIDGHVSEIRPGPVITMYEYIPAPGIKISKIASLADDLAMSMKALRVRIVAPLPGKGAVGIEIPNDSAELVYFKEIIASDAYRDGKHSIPVALGKDTEGNPVVADLAKMPHLLVAGATGAGKSVSINTMIMSILFRASPKQVRLLMIDPKMIELSVYNDIPHLLLPVVTDPLKAATALNWAVQEMERRYRMLSKVRVRGIASFNDKMEKMKADPEAPEFFTIQNAAGQEEEIECEPLPYIVIIVDELADLMMVAGREVETSIMRLAQKARAAGIHLILATQRPSVDVLTGVIKANFPTRISFQVSSRHDSRTILDQNGAENLLGRGDMLFLAPGAGGPDRVHGAFVTDEEIEETIEFVKAQMPTDYNEEILTVPEADENSSREQAVKDELYDEAIAVIAESGQASISMVQRRLRIGYNRAARMIEQMEEDGIVGPAKGSKPREVLVSHHSA